MGKAAKSLLSFATTSILVAGIGLTAIASDLGVVTGNTVNLREQASTDSTVLAQVVKNTVVEIRETQSGWFKVSYGSKEGYMSADYLKIAQDGQALPQEIAGTVNCSSLNVRAAASTDSAVVGSLAQGAAITIKAGSGDFYQITSGDLSGFVHKDYITIGATAGETVTRATVVCNSTLNLRSAPSTEGSVIKAMPNGTPVGVIENQGKWYYVIVDGVTGYAISDYVQLSREQVSRDNFASGRASYSSAGASVIEYAKQFIGTPYVYGGSTPKGFDCSGFVKYVFNHFGVSLPRTGTAQYNAGTKVSRSELQPGDIVAFGSSYLEHVGIYVGGGMFIHSPSPGNSVRIETLDSGYYNRKFWGGCRVL